MSLIAKESIQIIGQTIGINNVSNDVATALAPDVEYRVREIIQEALKFMRHSKRSTLTTSDVSNALRLRNVEELFGFSSPEPLRFRRVVGSNGLFYVDDADLDFDEIINAPLPRCPLDVTVVPHWLAIEGVQPTIPENLPMPGVPAGPQPTAKKARTEGAAGGGKGAAAAASTAAAAAAAASAGDKDGQRPALGKDVKPVIRHELSRELQLYFDRVTGILLAPATATLRDAVLASLGSDPGLHQLVPYFAMFITEQVSKGLRDIALLTNLLRALQALLANPHLQLELYLHQLLPSLLTCLLAKRVGSHPLEDHWAVRDMAASICAAICHRFASAYANLQPRVARTMLRAFLDPSRALTQHYGAVQGLAALGHRVVQMLILPNLSPYVALLDSAMAAAQKNQLRRYEACRCYGALQCAVGTCMLQRLSAYHPSVAALSKPGAPHKGAPAHRKGPHVIIHDSGDPVSLRGIMAPARDLPATVTPGMAPSSTLPAPENLAGPTPPSAGPAHPGLATQRPTAGEEGVLGQPPITNGTQPLLGAGDMGMVPGMQPAMSTLHTPSGEGPGLAGGVTSVTMPGSAPMLASGSSGSDPSRQAGPAMAAATPGDGTVATSGSAADGSAAGPTSGQSEAGTAKAVGPITGAVSSAAVAGPATSRPDQGTEAGDAAPMEVDEAGGQKAQGGPRVGASTTCGAEAAPEFGAAHEEDPLLDSWKDGSDLETQLAFMYDIFGQGILPFMPTSSLSLVI